MKRKTLIGLGAAGAAVTAVCCFTPALVILLGTIGLSAWFSWLDFVLLPALVVFTGLTVYGFTMKEKPC